ncbi:MULTISPECIES: hypothetical protein [Aerococcus]|uniref:hypothetical protein n=1 Tax=Aerococcus TaxID=1375 RepID=UPI0008A45CC9|nr:MULTISPECIES: hypothetical protein [Aerococcus]MDK6679194.1 hypothetical protein [Aerococcus sp. UMB8608]MDK6685964.1 hypothetical protein [Aerococcus sp. UMB8623]MDK6729421.1 hypothetical protein [Aerococcus urinae]MDK6940769.1 hypothetical protein [Aerococcus sp. UMB8487]OFK21381.1 hypothetical protein HMPREF2829_03700 [Aerococcus sp. HMSC072A12]
MKAFITILIAIGGGLIAGSISNYLKLRGVNDSKAKRQTLLILFVGFVLAIIGTFALTLI